MERSRLKKKRNIVVSITIVAMCLIVIIAATLVAIYSNSSERRLRRQINLGNRYLSELEYDQAISAFEEALSIDPMSEEAYLGIANAYVEMGDVEKAIEVLEEGVRVTQNPDIISRLDELKSMSTANKEDEHIDNGNKIVYLSGEDVVIEHQVSLNSWLDYYYLSHEQKEARVIPMIKKLEDYINLVEEGVLPDNYRGENISIENIENAQGYFFYNIQYNGNYYPDKLWVAYNYLSILYRDINNYDKCLEYRQKLAECVGNHDILTEHTVFYENGIPATTYDKYGRDTHSWPITNSDEWEIVNTYDDNGMLIRRQEIGTNNNITEYSYDSTGRIIESRYNGEGYFTIWKYEYEETDSVIHVREYQSEHNASFPLSENNYLVDENGDTKSQ